jgi:hypothetical protein
LASTTGRIIVEIEMLKLEFEGVRFRFDETYLPQRLFGRSFEVITMKGFLLWQPPKKFKIWTM